jgi:cytochrome c biogenesis protein CcmG/thiol:disulfide interchange protein DsbE
MENKERVSTGEWVEGRMAELEPAANWQPDATRALAGVRERDRRTASRRRAWSWAAAAASTVSVVVLAVPATRAAVYRACTAACAVVWPSVLAEDAASLTASAGGASDSTPGAAPDAKLPEPSVLDSGPAPDFALPEMEGRLVQLSDLKGKVVLLNFWATWCPPCQVEMPSFVDMQRKYRDRGFTVVAVSLDGGWEPVRSFAGSLKPNFPIVLGNDEMTQTFGGIAALPETFLIDREGAIRSRHTGLVSTGEYEQRIEQLLAEGR